MADLTLYCRLQDRVETGRMGISQTVGEAGGGADECPMIEALNVQGRT